MSLSIYPRIYVPLGVAKPACCAHLAGAGAMDGHGPDAVVAPDGTRSGGGGLTYGPRPWLPLDTTWRRTVAGWWIDLDGHRPQDLLRLEQHPRVLRWRTVPGVLAGQHWRIPVLLTPADGNPELGYLSAVDQVLGEHGWSAGDLVDLQAPLLAIAAGVPLHQDPEVRNATILQLTIDLLAIGHWIDRTLLIHTGWLTETLQMEVILAAIDRESVRAQDAA